MVGGVPVGGLPPPPLTPPTGSVVRWHTTPWEDTLMNTTTTSNGRGPKWQSVVAWIMIGCGTIAILAELAEWAFVGRTISLAGLIAIWIGIMALMGSRRSPG